MKRWEYLKTMQKELEEAVEILDRASGNMVNVIEGIVPNAGSHDGNVDLLGHARISLEDVIDNLSKLTFGYLNEEAYADRPSGYDPAEDDNVPAGSECPSCGEARVDHLEIGADGETVTCVNCLAVYNISTGEAVIDA